LGGVAVPKVFVSYAHESEQHRDDVLAFATFLRGQGVDAMLDVWSADARHDWYAWALREMTAAAYVIVVASPAYRAVGDGSGPADLHRGVQSEATLLRDLVYGDRGTWTPKVLPVLLPGHGLDEIPRFLSPHTTSRFTVAANTVVGAEELLRVIHRSPAHLLPPVLPAPELAPRPAPTAVVWCAGMPVDISKESVEIHLVPAEQVEPYSPEDMRRAVSAVGRLARLDASGSTAWAEKNGSGLAVLGAGQRSAWFTPSREQQLVDAVAERVAMLTAIDLARPTSWVPAIGAGAVRIVLRREASQELDPVDVAMRLTDDLLAQWRPEPRSANRVANMISGNASGTIIQAGDIHGGLYL
jgi:hypothetical protein